jgi:hypothetical protein
MDLFGVKKAIFGLKATFCGWLLLQFPRQPVAKNEKKATLLKCDTAASYEAGVKIVQKSKHWSIENKT